MKTVKTPWLVGLAGALALGAIGVSMAAFVTPSVPPAAAVAPAMPALDRTIARLAVNARATQLAELR